MIIEDGKVYLLGDGVGYQDVDGKPIKAHCDGNDLVIRKFWATNWGDSEDTSDSGTTSCGDNTRAHPGALLCSLPMTYPGSPETEGSPLPWIKCHRRVTWFRHSTNKTVDTLRSDTGPAKGLRPSRFGDLTDGAWEALGGIPELGRDICDCRIHGGVFDLPAGVITQVRAAQARLAKT